MFTNVRMKNRILSLLLLAVLLLVSLSCFACGGNGKKPENPPQPPVSEKRYCSFSVSNLDSAFSPDSIDWKVSYGINDAGNRKAVFMMYDSDHENPTILQAVENLGDDDYSFTVSDGKYTYKKETVLHLERGFFDKAEGEFFLSLCLFDEGEDSYDNPLTGYRCEVKYTVSDDSITFEVASESVFRHP